MNKGLKLVKKYSLLAYLWRLLIMFLLYYGI